MSKRIILSTDNKNKIREIKDILSAEDVEIATKKDFNINIEIEEDGETLEENSYKKAKEIWEKTKEIVIADDTGLFVKELKGEPGVKSARYAGEHSTDLENRTKLIEKLRNIENREAKFITIITIIDESGKVHIAKGECSGKIILEERGTNGFGYDSIFIPDGYDKTFAQLGDITKNKISHRTKALKNLKEILKKF